MRDRCDVYGTPLLSRGSGETPPRHGEPGSFAGCDAGRPGMHFPRRRGRANAVARANARTSWKGHVAMRPAVKVAQRTCAHLAKCGYGVVLYAGTGICVTVSFFFFLSFKDRHVFFLLLCSETCKFILNSIGGSRCMI